MLSIPNPFARSGDSLAQTTDSQMPAPLFAAQAGSATQIQSSNTPEVFSAYLSQQCLALTNALGTPATFGLDETQGWWISVSHWRLPVGLNREHADITLLLPGNFPHQPPMRMVVPNDLGGEGWLLSAALPVELAVDEQLIVGKQWQLCAVPVDGRKSGLTDLTATFAMLHLILTALARIAPAVRESAHTQS